MTARKMNPEGTLLAFGDNVRAERGHDKPDKDSPMVWIVFKKVDVTDDEDTTYTYRFDEVARYSEDKPGECPVKAIERAEALASKG